MHFRPRCPTEFQFAQVAAADQFRIAREAGLSLLMEEVGGEECFGVVADLRVLHGTYRQVELAEDRCGGLLALTARQG